MANIRTREACAVLLALVAAPAPAQERVHHALGEFEVLAAPAGVLIAAPHGTHDARTDALAIAAARGLAAGYVVARRFTPDKVRLNVNRPSEGASVACADEARTERAREVYDAYARLVGQAAGGAPLRLYVEVHGNANPRTAAQIEVATVGLGAAQAQRVKDGYAAMLARVRERAAGYPPLALAIEPVERIHFTASCAKTIGFFTAPVAPRVVHIELPRAARERDALEGTAMLVAEIVRAVLETTP